jgi:hypothetical protein
MGRVGETAKGRWGEGAARVMIEAHFQCVARTFGRTKTGTRSRTGELQSRRQLSQKGKRENRYFATKADAQTFVGELKERRARFGSLASYLTAQQVAEASAALQMLAPTGASLLDAAREYLVLHSARNQSATVAALFDQFAALPGTKSARQSNIR